MDFTLADARRFYSSRGDPLKVKGLKHFVHLMTTTVLNFIKILQMSNERCTKKELALDNLSVWGKWKRTVTLQLQRSNVTVVL